MPWVVFVGQRRDISLIRPARYFRDLIWGQRRDISLSPPARYFLDLIWRPAARYFLQNPSGEIFILGKRRAPLGGALTCNPSSGEIFGCLDLGKGGISSRKTSFWNPLLEASSSGRSSHLEFSFPYLAMSAIFLNG